MSRKLTSIGTDQTHPGCDYSDDESEFILAMERYRRTRRKRFPTCREILEVLKDLGYRKHRLTTEAQRHREDA